MGGGGHTEETQLKGIQLQTSSYGLPIPLVYGTARLSANLIWYGNFQAIPHETSSGGKGGGFTSTSYTYKVAAMLGLCEGQIAGVGSVWKGKDKSDLATLGLTLFAGAQGQATWSWLTGYATPGAFSSLYGISFASLENLLGYHGQPTYNPQALNYSGTAYLAASGYDLGTTTSIPNHGFEIQGLNIFGGSVQDANPSVVMSDFLTNAEYGAGFSASWLASLSNYSNYCCALGLFISPAISAQKKASDFVKEWADATNTALVWSEGVLKFIPYGDTAASNTINATVYSFTPNTTPLYDLNDDDFIGDKSQDPIRVDRITPADAFNRVQIEYLNRANQYNSEVVDVKDQRDIELYGLRTQPSIKLDFICDSNVAKQVAQIMLQRALYIRNSYEFQLGWKYAVLEPMDLVTLTDAALGLNKTPVRITEISEDVDGKLTVLAEDFPLGTASATLYPHDNAIRYQARVNDSPSNVATPLFFEAPSALTTTGLQVWTAVGGQPSDALYGGCTVWVSLDGTNYKSMGKLYGSSRYGLTTANYAAHAAGMDSTNTLSLGLSANGQLNSATASDAAAGTSLVALGQEYVAFTTATLTGTLAYNLTSVNRGLYSTNGALHVAGSAWARIDSAIGKSDNLAMSMIGKTIYFKFTAFNIYGGGEQPLSSVSAYTYPVTGYMTQLPPSTVASLTATVDAALNITLSWPAVADLDIGSYELRDGASWAAATVIGAVKGTIFKIALVSGAHTYQIKAIDVNGNYSAAAATTSVTVSTASAVTLLAVMPVTVTGSAGTQSPALNISWTAANSAILQSTAVEYKKSADSVWIAYANVTPPAVTAQIVGIEPGTSYDVRVAELYNNGIKSAYATISSTTSLSSQTVAVAASAPWSGVTGAAKPADNATADLLLIPRGSCTAIGNTIYNITGSGSWGSGDCYSSEAYVGGAFVSFSSAEIVHAYFMLGLNQDPTTDMTYGSIDFGWFCRAGNPPAAYESGSQVFADTGNIATSDVFSIVYNGYSVLYYRNGVLKWTSAATITTGLKLYVDSAFANAGSIAANVKFGPYSSSAWADVGGTGKPADNATKNVVTRATSAPSAPTAGDIWVDTTIATYPIVKHYDGSAWQIGASYGSIAGTNLLSSTGVPLGDAAIITSSGTAAAIAGQGALATLGAADFATQVTGATKPAANATKNIVTYSSTAPSTPIDGDLWVDTSVSPNLSRVHVTGAWQIASSYNTGALANLNQADTGQIVNNAINNIVVVLPSNYTVASGSVLTDFAEQLSYTVGGTGKVVIDTETSIYGNGNTSYSFVLKRRVHGAGASAYNDTGLVPGASGSAATSVYFAGDQTASFNVGDYIKMGSSVAGNVIVSVSYPYPVLTNTYVTFTTAITWLITDHAFTGDDGYVTIDKWTDVYKYVGSNNNNLRQHMRFVDAPSAGTYDYKVQVGSYTNANTTYLKNNSMAIQEIKK
jgi:hypothetical protein